MKEELVSIHLCVRAESKITGLILMNSPPKESPFSLYFWIYMTCSDVMSPTRIIQAELDKQLHTGTCPSGMPPLGAHPLYSMKACLA